MQTSNDIEYIRTKQVLRGELVHDSQTAALIRWISNRFGITVLHIEFDTIDKGEWDRIHIIVKTISDYEKMQHYGKDYSGNNIEFRDEIVEACVAVFDITTRYLEKPFKGTNTKKPWVCYSAFEEVAMTEISLNITVETHAAIQAEFADMGIWQIVQFFGATIVFLTTGDQLTQINNDRAARLEQRLYDASKLFDEFNLLEPDRFSIHFDTKENLDKNYDGNLLSYFR
jgi:hypothetical protein